MVPALLDLLIAQHTWQLLQHAHPSGCGPQCQLSIMLLTVMPLCVQPQEASKQQEAAAAAAARLEQQRQEALAPVVALAAAVQQRGYQLTSPQVG
jgi:hypothetical protein